MAAVAGWIIICTGFSLVGAALLWPAYRRLRGQFARRWQARSAYAAATACTAVALWFLVPLVVGALFGRAPH